MENIDKRREKQMRKTIEKQEHLVCFHFSIVAHRKSKKHYGGYKTAAYEMLDIAVFS